MPMCFLDTIFDLKVLSNLWGRRTTSSLFELVYWLPDAGYAAWPWSEMAAFGLSSLSSRSWATSSCSCYKFCMIIYRVSWSGIYSFLSNSFSLFSAFCSFSASSLRYLPSANALHDDICAYFSSNGVSACNILGLPATFVFRSLFTNIDGHPRLERGVRRAG